MEFLTHAMSLEFRSIPAKVRRGDENDGLQRHLVVKLTLPRQRLKRWSRSMALEKVEERGGTTGNALEENTTDSKVDESPF